MLPVERISQFFESYAHALEIGDTKGIAWHYHLPCMLMDSERSYVYTDSTKLEGLFNQGMIFYRQHGVTEAAPELWSKQVVSDSIVRVKIIWHYFRGKAELLYQCEYQYLLRFNKGMEWKIDLALSVNEKQKIEEWLRRQKR